MIKYKVGDKVKITTSDQFNGLIGVIIATDNDHLIYRINILNSKQHAMFNPWGFNKKELSRLTKLERAL